MSVYRKKGMFLEYFATSKEKPRYSEYNLPPITKLNSWMSRISRQWAGGKVHVTRSGEFLGSLCRISRCEKGNLLVQNM